jgi:hypothetical protein
MTRLRTITVLALVATVILFVTSRDCSAQQRRQIVGGEKWVWDPVMKQWVYHQGTKTLRANRGNNAPPKNSYFGGGQPSSGERSSTTTSSIGSRRQIAGGEKWVWDPVIRQWVYHQGTKTLKANRGSNALPRNSYFDGGSPTGVTNAKAMNSPQPQQKAVGGKIYVWNSRLKRWVLPPAGKNPSVTSGSQTGVSQKPARSPQAKRVITNPYLGK